MAGGPPRAEQDLPSCQILLYPGQALVPDTSGWAEGHLERRAHRESSQRDFTFCVPAAQDRDRARPPAPVGPVGESGAGTHRPVCSNGVSTQKGPRPPESSGVGLPGGGSWGRRFMERKGKEVALTVAWSLVVEPGWRGSPQGGEGPRVRSLGSTARGQGALEVLSP